MNKTNGGTEVQMQTSTNEAKEAVLGLIKAFETMRASS
jgi:hypothetical protein